MGMPDMKNETGFTKLQHELKETKCTIAQKHSDMKLDCPQRSDSGGQKAIVV
jgi:hypothetical protein